MNEHRRRRLVSTLLRLLSAALLAHVLLIYAPFSPVALLVIAFLAFVTLLLPPGKALPLVISLVVTTVLLEGVIRLGGFGITPYFRAHEMLALDTTYLPNRKVDMTVPHGDLLTIDPSLPKTLAIARREVFATDAFGHRNDRDYKGEKLVIVGDSFIVGTETTLTAQLEGDHRLPAYNAGFSSIGPLIYADKVQWARRTLAPGACIAQFYFEGNDFQLVDPSQLAVRDAVPRGFQRIVKGYIQAIRRNSEWAKVFYGLVTRAAENMRPKAPPSNAPSQPVSFLKTVGGRPIAFLHGYSQVVRRTSFDDHGFIRSRLAQATPDVVYFVPDKFRVYAPMLDEGAEHELPHAQWHYLKDAADQLGIPAIDLTPHLVEQSRALLAEGETTYWPDDTHWNAHGQEVAARVLIETLRNSSLKACAEAVGNASAAPVRSASITR